MLLPVSLQIVIIILVLAAIVLLIRKKSKRAWVADTQMNRIIIKAASIVLAIVWYLGLAMMAFLTVYELAINKEGPVIGYPIRFEIEEEGVLQYNEETVFEVEIERAEGELQIEDTIPWGLKAYSLAVMLLGMALSLGIIYFLRKMVASLREAGPFTSANARRMRWIALLVIGLGVAKWLFTWIYYRLLASKVVLAGIEAQMDKLSPLTFGIPGDYITEGILLLLLAEVFRQGVVLQDEQRLTV